MSCPEIDVLLSTSGRQAASAHVEGCAACAAIASLADVRQERLDGQDDECALAEVRIAVWHAGTLGVDEQRELVAHLEACEACNGVAVRVRSLPRYAEEAPTEPSAAASWLAPARSSRGKALVGLAFGAGMAAASAVALSVGLRLEPSIETPTAERNAAPAELPAGTVRSPGADPSPALVPSGVGSSPSPITSGDLETGYITLICEPGCQVFDSGRHVGDSPLIRYPVPAGPHVLVARRGDQERRVGVRVEAGLTVSRRVVMDEGASEVIDPWTTPPAGTSSAPVGDEVVNPFASSKGVGYLTLMCIPGCDHVRVDSRDLGPSPVVREAVATGSHSVTLRRGGVVKVRQITISEGQTTALRVDMVNAAAPSKPPPKKLSDELIDPFR